MGYNNLGKYYMGRGDGARAAQCFQQAIDHHHPDPWNLYYNLGQAQVLMQDSTMAEKSFRQAIDLRPDYADAHNRLGTLYWREAKPRWEAAEDEFRKAIAADSSSWSAHYNLGALLLDLGRLTEARLELDRAIDLAPDFAPAHYKLGQLQLREGQIAEATSSFQRAVDLDPKDPVFRDALEQARRRSKSR
jgi:tetratricopeptide (TPR) repeat protein